MVETFRDFSTRLDDFCKLKNYKLIIDSIDYVIFETDSSERIYCSGQALHLAMLEVGIR